ncbi:MAG: DedA family protein [Rubricoccaceae bacterium]|nr:DedA family protein [Rubricoccaceae bacterium]
MFEFLQDFSTWMQSLPPLGIYTALFLVAYVENLIPPFPGDVNVVIGGYLVGLGLVSFIPSLLLVSVGSALGFMTMFGVGKLLGDAVEDPQRLRWIPKKPVGTVKKWLQRWGYGVVLVNRFLSGSRAVITLLAGASDLKPFRTFVLSLISALGWYFLLLYGGYSVGANWESLLPIMRAYGQIVMSVLALLALIAFARWRLKRQKALSLKNGEDTTA